MEKKFSQRVYEIVERIPYGKVVSYGQIAQMIGAPGSARQVGWALRHCPDELPWQRVIRNDGTVAGGACAEDRREMLLDEGVPVLPDGRIDIEACRWDGRG